MVGSTVLQYVYRAFGLLRDSKYLLTSIQDAVRITGEMAVLAVCCSLLVTCTSSYDTF